MFDLTWVQSIAHVSPRERWRPSVTLPGPQTSSKGKKRVCTAAEKHTRFSFSAVSKAKVVSSMCWTPSCPLFVPQSPNEGQRARRRQSSHTHTPFCSSEELQRRASIPLILVPVRAHNTVKTPPNESRASELHSRKQINQPAASN